MAVTAHGKASVSSSAGSETIYSVHIPELKLTGSAELTGEVGWGDAYAYGKTAYVANPVTNDVSVVDVKTMKEVAKIPVGFVPKRNTTGFLE